MADSGAMSSRTLCALAVSLAACTGPRTAAAPGPSAERFLTVVGGAGALRVSDGGGGDGLPVVLLHGLGSELEVWRPVLDHLREHRRAVAWDQRGHGGSARAPGGYSIDALAEDLEAVRSALGLERVVLVAHSLSGAVATSYAGAHPERVAGLVYVDAIGDFGAVPREALQPTVEREAGYGPEQVRAAFDEMLDAKAKPATRAAVLASAARLDPPAFGALRRGLFEFRDAKRRLDAVRAPAIAIEAAAPRYGAVLASNTLGLPRTEVADVSHWLQLDDPGALNRALDAFLATVPITPRDR